MRPPASVLVVGAGLLGASVGMALRRRGIEVWLDDREPAAVRVAASLGAGRPGRPDRAVDLAVVAVPPAATGAVVGDVLAAGTAAVVTDVASVKQGPAEAVAERLPTQASRYVGGHPMAGREVSGAAAARGDLFEARPWVVCPGPGTDPAALDVVEGLVHAVGATAVRLSPSEHDAAVALVSHAPHLLASLVAGQLAAAPAEEVGLAGPGISDITRVAAGDPTLWSDILSANAPAVRGVLAAVRDDLDAVLAALGEPTGGRALQELLARGVAGRARLPGKHGGRRTEFAPVPVVLADRPGQLAALFADVGSAGANVEDVRIEHSPGQPVGLVQLAVRPDQAAPLAAELRQRGWTVHD